MWPAYGQAVCVVGPVTLHPGASCANKVMRSTAAGVRLAVCAPCPCLLLLLLQVRVELSDEQRQLYKAILGRNYEALVGECVWQ